jgi:hypothetical protein
MHGVRGERTSYVISAGARITADQIQFTIMKMDNTGHPVQPPTMHADAVINPWDGAVAMQAGVYHTSIELETVRGAADFLITFEPLDPDDQVQVFIMPANSNLMSTTGIFNGESVLIVDSMPP